MAKVSFTKLGLTKNQEVKIVNWNGQDIEVKQYLPVNEKLTLISNVLNSAHDENNFSNPVKVNLFTALEIMYAYTNINFTDKQKEDPVKLYDLLSGSKLYDKIVENIPAEEYLNVMNGIDETIDAVYTYRNSVMGILDTVSTDYSALEFDASAIKDKLSDKDNLNLLRDVLSKLG